MRTGVVKISLAVLLTAVTVAACSDEPSKPEGPVTLKFRTPVYRTYSVTNLDTVKASVLIDGTTLVEAPDDSVTDFPRGTHTFEVRNDNDYRINRFTENVDPYSKTAIIVLPPAPTCRVYTYDAPYCQRRNFVASRQSRVYCPVSDFGEFCTYFVDSKLLGGSWPVDSFDTAENEYVAYGKLLIGAKLNGAKVATAFYDPGDYSPRIRHHVTPGDSTYWQSTAWTDARHITIYPETLPKLSPFDRPGRVLGLSVRTTYVVPSAHKNAMFIRFDVTNISDSADYRRVHPDVPVGGHTITDVYLAPVIDPDIGGIRFIDGTTVNDAIDDNATAFPTDSLVIAYDQEFAVPAFGGGYNNKPGLVGMRLIEGPASTTPRALILDSFTELTYGLTSAKATLEDSTYNVISGGRPDTRSNCEVRGTVALVCKEGLNPEVEHDVRMGWSVGPIPSIAPGQTVSLTIAIIFAPPTAGTFTSGASVAPDNSESGLGSTTRTIYNIAGQIRALAATVKGFVVNGTAR